MNRNLSEGAELLQAEGGIKATGDSPLPLQMFDWLGGGGLAVNLIGSFVLWSLLFDGGIFFQKKTSTKPQMGKKGCFKITRLCFEGQ